MAFGSTRQFFVHLFGQGARARAIASGQRVLVLGIYLANKPNTVTHLVREFSRSRRCRIEQRWVALNGSPPNRRVARVTTLRAEGVVPKFTLINQLLAQVSPEDYDFVVVCDDDITLPSQFVDDFITRQDRHGFALAQPARTHQSYLDHALVEVREGLDARQTRFVEIGPVFCVRKDAFSLLLPFDERAPMGWGLDFVWPVLIEAAGLRMGIIDATPVDHSLRKPFTQYNGDMTLGKMHSYLDHCPHLEPEEAFVVVKELRA